MKDIQMLRSKQFKSLFNKELLKYYLGINGLYAEFKIKKKFVKIIGSHGKIYVIVNGIYIYSKYTLESIWNNPNLVFEDIFH